MSFYRLLHMDTPVLTDQAKIYIHQLLANTGCCQEDLLRAMADRYGWKRDSKESVMWVRLDDDDDDIWWFGSYLKLFEITWFHSFYLNCIISLHVNDFCWTETKIFCLRFNAYLIVFLLFLLLFHVFPLLLLKSRAHFAVPKAISPSWLKILIQCYNNYRDREQRTLFFIFFSSKKCGDVIRLLSFHVDYFL